MDDMFTRSRMLLGDEAINKLKTKSVIIFGVGGVGSFVAEGVARMGVGAITLVDGDSYALSNLNRQLYANNNTIGENKAVAAKRAISLVNPDCNVTAVSKNYNSETEKDFDFSQYDYVVDAIDTVTDKVKLIIAAKNSGTPVISSMGAGNKLDPTAFRVGDIYETKVCPLARIMRKLLKEKGIDSLKTVYSTEPPIIREENGRTPGSVSFVPSVAGLIIAGEVVKDLIK
ncbi:MAG: tRNA threonylcarbamoyladenosine dehydratase [Clostridia bacterium]|nr:tRNA threonylcarbamoyladenosine dehydratase [Clostridia bacterium]